MPASSPARLRPLVLLLLLPGALLWSGGCTSTPPGEQEGGNSVPEAQGSESPQLDEEGRIMDPDALRRDQKSRMGYLRYDDRTQRVW